MTDIQYTPIQRQLIAASKLVKSPLNARRTNVTMGMEELKASILAHGLMQNLVVTDAGDGTYRVIAGGRRLEAIHSLLAEGTLPEDFAVPCQMVTEEQAPEMSLAENMVRLAMHPADQFEAFASLIDHGASAAEVAVRFGIEENVVLKRMKLARVAPQLLAEYRGEGLTLECLMAFTITDDQRRQLKVFKSLQDWQKDDPSAIRAALTEKLIEASDKLARFVGLDAYQAAGGSIRADLFGDEVYLEKPSLLNKLAQKKLEAIREELEAEGWKWLEINPERDWNFINRCHRIQPQLIDVPSDLIDLKTQLDAELAEIEQSLEDSESDELIERQRVVQERLEQAETQLVPFVGFPEEQKLLAGCCVSIGQDGMPFIDKGLVRPEERKQWANLLGTGEGGTPAKPKGSLPESLRRDLAAERLQVARVEMAKHPLIVLDLLIYQIAVSMLDQPFANDGAEMQFKRPKTSGETESTIAGEAFDTMAKTLSVGWLKEPSDSARFAAFRSLDETAKLDLLAYSVALTLKPKLAPAAFEESTAYDLALSLTGASVAGYWRPTKANLLSRLGREQLLVISRDVMGDAWAQAHSSDKKALLVDQLDRAFANPEKYGRTPGQLQMLKSWLPTGMSFQHPSSPQSTQSGKTKQAA